MYVYFSRILGFFIMPVGIILLLLLAALILLLRKRKRVAASLLLVAVMFTWVCSMPAVGENLLGKLEAGYPRIAVEEVPRSDCMVLLGGSTRPGKDRSSWYREGSTPKRTAWAVELYEAGKSGMIIVSAGNQPWRDGRRTEAEIIRELLVKKDIPAEAILLEMSSRNTRENAVFTSNLLHSIDCKSPLLITSAAHMQRAVAAFRAVGVQVIPVATDYRVDSAKTAGLRGIVPSIDAFNMTSRAVREWVGRKVYERRGWN